ncbi:MAG: peptide MFS transporter [Muribaculaceae bacterium]|nr:peptide MFS transporter [Muribaculaceae bacterium]
MFKNHPKGLIPAALSNMGERFGYYIMNAVLLLFLCSKFGLSDETSGIIYSVFYALIYVLSLVGGYIADKRQNYKGTIMTGLVIMATGYVLMAIPIMATGENISWLLPFTCAALLMIAFGNGLFKGNLQAIVGQMYDNLEAEAAKKGPESLEKVKGRRDSGFQIFYVFINIGGLVAPFIAPYLREWWLGVNDLTYNAELPALCHQFLAGASSMTAEASANLATLVSEVSNGAATVSTEFCQNYLNVFNTGVHYSFFASVAAMAISLTIFFFTRKLYPTPKKKTAVETVNYTPEEKKAMAKEIKQRMYALFAVLGIAIFFWFSFHQNGQSLSVFARDFVKTDSIAPEIWQAVNPFFVIVLTPIIMLIFGFLSKRGKEISTPRKIAYGMGIAGLAYLFLMVYSMMSNYPSGEDFKAMDVAVKETMKAGPWVLIVTYFFLTVAELFISPLGLSFVSKVAPKSMQGLCQGLWLGATAVGNLLIWIGPLMYNKWNLWVCWGVFLFVCLLSMGVMFGMVKWLERVTSDKAQDAALQAAGIPAEGSAEEQASEV